MNEPLRYYLDLYEEYGFGVLPIGPDKRPQFNLLPEQDEKVTWAAYQSRRATDLERRQWWPSAYEDGHVAAEAANVGVVTGAVSNLLVLDFDNALAAATATAAMPWLSETMAVTTGRGTHVYLRPSEPAGATFALRLGDAPEMHHVKSEGGYVVAPPSLHQTGAVYTMVSEDLTVVDPAELVAGLKAAGFVDAKPKVEERPADWYMEMFDGVTPKGGRSDRAVSLAGMLRHYIPDRPGLTQGLVLCWNERHCSPPLEEREVSAIVRSMYGRYAE